MSISGYRAFSMLVIPKVAEEFFHVSVERIGQWVVHAFAPFLLNGAIRGHDYEISVAHSVRNLSTVLRPLRTVLGAGRQRLNLPPVLRAQMTADFEPSLVHKKGSPR